MCRFLMLQAEKPFAPREIFDRFREGCRRSPEYQGHGWGASFRADGRWTRHKSLTPIWLDELELPEEVDFLVVHARSAFRDQDIALENNMPFYDDGQIFVFNGELHGVRLRLPGRIGAEKVFRLIQREDRGDLSEAIASADRLLHRKSHYVRAMNLAIADEKGDRIHAICRFGESPDYFTLHRLTAGGERGVCSEPLDRRWQPMENGERVTL